MSGGVPGLNEMVATNDIPVVGSQAVVVYMPQYDARCTIHGGYTSVPSPKYPSAVLAPESAVGRRRGLAPHLRRKERAGAECPVPFAEVANVRRHGGPRDKRRTPVLRIPEVATLRALAHRTFATPGRFGFHVWRRSRNRAAHLNDRARPAEESMWNASNRDPRFTFSPVLLTNYWRAAAVQTARANSLCSVAATHHLCC